MSTPEPPGLAVVRVWDDLGRQLDDAGFTGPIIEQVVAAIDEIRRLRVENERLRWLLAEVAGSGVELQDNRMRYLVVQINCDVWARVTEASAEEKHP